MVTYVTQQSLAEMSNVDYPRKLHRAATYDSVIPPSMTCRKRLLSEQNEFNNIMMKFSDDEIHSNKKRKTGNYARQNLMQRMNKCTFI
jgi:hypothetical protein